MSGISVDTSQLLRLLECAVKAEALANEWYPVIGVILGVEIPLSPDGITIHIDIHLNEAGGACGKRILVGARHALNYPNDLGVLIHELTHVVQAYPRYDPVWLVEGIADYVRFFHFEPQTLIRPDPATADACQSYRITAHFLNWLTQSHNPDLVKRLNASLQSGTYTDALFPELTGQTLDELNDQWRATLR